MKLIIWTVLLFVFLYFVYRQQMDGLRPIAIGPVLLSMGMICQQLRVVAKRGWLRQSLAVMYWGLLAASVTTVLYFAVTR